MTEAAAGPEEVARGFLCAGTVMMFCAEAETWPVFSASLRRLLDGPAGWRSLAERAVLLSLDRLRLEVIAMYLYAQCVGVAVGVATNRAAEAPSSAEDGLFPGWEAVAAVTVRFVSEPERWPVFLAWAGQPENPQSAAEFLAVEGPEGLHRVCAAAVTHA